MNKLDKLKRYAANFIVNVPIMILSLTCIFPVVWLLYSSVKTDVEFNRSPVSLPSQIHLDNYIAAFNKASFGTFTFNSLFNSVDRKSVV